VSDKYLKLSEIAAELRISHEKARQMVSDGAIKGLQVGGPGSVWRIEAKSYRDFLAKSAERGQAIPLLPTPTARDCKGSTNAARRGKSPLLPDVVMALFGNGPEDNNNDDETVTKVVVSH
jgi:hypothetical protein